MGQNNLGVAYGKGPGGNFVPLSVDAAGALAVASGEYVACPASSTTPCGSAGDVGDVLTGVLIIPGTVAAGAVSIKDGTTSIQVFPGGGTSALVDLKPFFVPLGAVSVNGGWSVVTGANVTAIAVGEFV